MGRHRPVNTRDGTRKLTQKEGEVYMRWRRKHEGLDGNVKFKKPPCFIWNELRTITCSHHWEALEANMYYSVEGRKRNTTHKFLVY